VALHDLHGQSTPGVRFAHAISTLADPVAAMEDIVTALAGFGQIDLLTIFVSAHHADEAAQIVAQIVEALSPAVSLGVTADAVIAGSQEYERTPGIAVLAGSLPGVTVHPFATPTLDYGRLAGGSSDQRLRELVGINVNLRTMLFFADPFSVPMNQLLPALNRIRDSRRDGKPAGAIVGGLASGGAKAGQNVLLVNGRVLHRGFVGVSLSGPVRVDTVVSQGCRPIGENMIITKAKANVIYELGGRPAMDVLKDLLDSLGMNDRKLLRKGLFVGRVVSEYKDHYGRGDYLIRNVAGVNPKTKIIAVQDLVRAGQTVRFHIRDAQTAQEDLELLLDAQKLYTRPAGVLLISCTGRGRNLFETSHHDAQTIEHAFALEEPGEEAAKFGSVLDTGQTGVPMAGFFAAGEIGPVGENSYLHGHSACAVIFREA